MCYTFDKFRNRLELTGTLRTVTALRISAGRSSEPIGSDLPVIKDALGQPLIPGSSLKGAMRSRLESFLRGILGDDRKLVANPAIEAEWSLTANELKELKKELKEEWENLRDKEQFKKDEILTARIIEQTDLISKLFGSPWVASKLQIRDLTVVTDTWFGQYQERDGVAIDRDTETSADKKLYDFQVVPAGTSFEFRLIVENAEPWELGLLTIAIHQLETEQIPLGGGRSRGLGVVRLEIDKMQWFDAEDKPKELLTYLQNLVKGQVNNYIDLEDDRKALRKEWTEALISHLTKEMSKKKKAEEESRA